MANQNLSEKQQWNGGGWTGGQSQDGSLDLWESFMGELPGEILAGGTDILPPPSTNKVWCRTTIHIASHSTLQDALLS